jgi:hypothetical protein
MAIPPVRLPRIRGTQVGLRDPSLVDTLKADMLQGRFEYLKKLGRIRGVKDHRGVFHVTEGHHRMVAALEIYRETGDITPVFQLLAWGVWQNQRRRPHDSRPMPSRSWWGKFRNWIGY